MHLLAERYYPEPAAAKPEAFDHDARGPMLNGMRLEALISYLLSGTLAAALVGGLNAHVAHHLFPAVSHAHYPAISAIIERLARRHQITHRRTTWIGLIGAHFRHLRRLGQANAV